MTGVAEPFAYTGTELDLFAGAQNWRRYWSDHVRPYIGRSVLEVGAGIGSVTEALWHEGVADWLALEPDASLCGQLSATVARQGRAGIRVLPDTVAALPDEAMFDTALYIDVMEHIEDDRAEMARVAAHICPGGHVIILAPAHQLLFTPFDRAIGHFRRYDRASLVRLDPPGFSRVVLRYLDCVGLLASLGNRIVLRSAMPTRAQIALWDGWMVPLSRRLDGLAGYRLGKSILGIWRRDPDPPAQSDASATVR